MPIRSARLTDVLGDTFARWPARWAWAANSDWLVGRGGYCTYTVKTTGRASERTTQFGALTQDPAQLLSPRDAS